MQRSSQFSNSFDRIVLWVSEHDVAHAKTPKFVIRAPVAAWRKVIEKQLDPIRALMTRQLRLKGTMPKIMKHPKAATELVNCCTLVDTTWPE